MDERTKELGSQLNSAAEEEAGKDGKEKDQEEKIEDIEDEEDTEESEKKENENEEDEDAEDGQETEEEEPAGDKKEDKTKTEKAPKTEKEKQDRWHGKSREEVIKSFEELEKQAEESKNKKTEVPDETEKPEKQEKKPVDDLEIPGDEELAKMTPKGFAEWMIKTVGKMVEKTYETRGRVKDAVAAEIREAQKDHPLLKTNQEYREMTLALIDAASKKGEVLALKEACAKVDTVIGTVTGESKITDEDKARLKKAKAQVERGAGAPASPGEEKGAEEKRLESIFGTGRSKSPFGGLGV